MRFISQANGKLHKPDKVFHTVKLVFLVTIFFEFSCSNQASNPKPVYKTGEPDYNKVELNLTTDTLHFQLSDDSYNNIKSFNVFEDHGVEYISFYDRRSESLSIYDFHSQNLVKRIALKNSFPNQKLYKTSAYIKNLDSIFITNKAALLLLDSSGQIKKTINFLKEPRFCWAYFDNTNPPIFRDNKIYMGVRMFAEETSLKALRKWKVLYEFDMKLSKAKLYYNLPKLYQDNFFGHRFLDCSYCYNDKGNFVFSFGADSVVYETNLDDYHVAYYAKSYLQADPITPVSKKDLINDEGSKQYAIRDSYGAVFYDPYGKRYLRIAYSRVDEDYYLSKSKAKQQRLIILDDKFRIIGESTIQVGVYLNSLFFSTSGKLYARVNSIDEYALHFIRLEYNEKSVQKTQFAQVNEDKK